MTERLSYHEQKRIRNLVKELNTEHAEELFRMIQKETKDYTTNNNGIFINMKDLNNEVLLKIKRYVDYITQIDKNIEREPKEK